jgi:hypothetical protein
MSGTVTIRYSLRIQADMCAASLQKFCYGFCVCLDPETLPVIMAPVPDPILPFDQHPDEM